MENQFCERKDSLCWDCQKAIGKCSWSEYGKQEPVPGWTVEVTKRTERVNGYTYDRTGMTVLACPLFEEDENV